MALSYIVSGVFSDNSVSLHRDGFLDLYNVVVVKNFSDDFLDKCVQVSLEDDPSSEYTLVGIETKNGEHFVSLHKDGTSHLTDVHFSAVVSTDMLGKKVSVIVERCG